MNIESYFKVLTEDNIEQHELKAKQVFRKEQRLTEQVASKVIDLVESNINIPIIIIDDASDCQYKDIPAWSVTVGRPEDPLSQRFATYSKIA